VRVRAASVVPTSTLPWLPLPPPPPPLLLLPLLLPPPKPNPAGGAPPAAAPKLNAPAVLGDTSRVPLPAAMGGEGPPKLKGALIAEALSGSVAAAPAAAAVAGVAKLTVPLEGEPVLDAIANPDEFG
jgi:hypothetical protein